jgi:hypothetical protein
LSESWLLIFILELRTNTEATLSTWWSMYFNRRSVITIILLWRIIIVLVNLSLGVMLVVYSSGWCSSGGYVFSRYLTVVTIISIFLVRRLIRVYLLLVLFFIVIVGISTVVSIVVVTFPRAETDLRIAT